MCPMSSSSQQKIRKAIAHLLATEAVDKKALQNNYDVVKVCLQEN